MARRVIEHTLRRQVAAIANVTFRSQCRVVAIAPDAIRPMIRYENVAGALAVLEADFVVDASGRGAPTLGLLDVLGWERPLETVVGVNISYTTAVLRRADISSDAKMLTTLPDPAISALAAVVMPIEGRRWLVSIAQHGATDRPQTWEDFLALARQLNTQTIYDSICGVPRPDGLKHFVFDESRWRHFEQLEKVQRGILPVADSLCRFNPIYGQGMSVAALEAKLLRDIMDRVGGEADPIEAMQSEFMSKVGSVLQAPWNRASALISPIPPRGANARSGTKRAGNSRRLCSELSRLIRWFRGRFRTSCNS